MPIDRLFTRLGPSVVCAGSLTSLPDSAWELAASELTTAHLWVHIDIMDGIFTPHVGVDMTTLGWLKEKTTGNVDFHLMVDAPDEVLGEVLAFYPQRVTVHAERLTDAIHTAGAIRSAGASPWVAISPNSPVESLTDVIDHFDGALVLLVRPGTSDGADLTMSGRLRSLAQFRHLGVDGGVTRENLSLWVDAGASYIVVGRALFGTSGPEAASSR